MVTYDPQDTGLRRAPMPSQPPGPSPWQCWLVTRSWVLPSPDCHQAGRTQPFQAGFSRSLRAPLPLLARSVTCLAPCPSAPFPHQTPPPTWAVSFLSPPRFLTFPTHLCKGEAPSKRTLAPASASGDSPQVPLAASTPVEPSRACLQLPPAPGLSHRELNSSSLSTVLAQESPTTAPGSHLEHSRSQCSEPPAASMVLAFQNCADATGIYSVEPYASRIKIDGGVESHRQLP